MLRVIRNDDVASDTTLHEIRTFCEICDRYGVQPMHAITPIGSVRPIRADMDNARIRREAGTALFSENVEVVEYLRGRTSDLFAVHGLWHTHEPSASEIDAADAFIGDAGFVCKYFVPPFNEGDYDEFAPTHHGLAYLKVCGRGVPRLEEYLEAGDPQSEIVYLHTNRFTRGPFTFDQLDRCLKRLTQR